MIGTSTCVGMVLSRAALLFLTFWPVLSGHCDVLLIAADGHCYSALELGLGSSWSCER